MNDRIIRTFACICLLVCTSVVTFGDNFILNAGSIAAILLVVVVITTAFYLAFFSPALQESQKQKAKGKKFEIAGLMLILVCLPVKFIYPKFGTSLFLILLAAVYFFIFRPGKKEIE